MFRQIDGKLCALLSDVAAVFFVPWQEEVPKLWSESIRIHQVCGQNPQILLNTWRKMVS